MSLAAPAGGAESPLNAQQPGKIKTSKAIYFDQISETKSWQAQNVFGSIVDCLDKCYNAMHSKKQALA